ncbi:MAG: phosphate signaling complex protein PhoU [Chloroflexi bacterium]|nr:phosphate signaling complex protein PhoU [Chloroflexota bacterium]
MLRVRLQEELARVERDVLALGVMVEEAIKASVDALVRRDREAAERIIENDRLINERRFAIESDILVLIATQQPIARDLRLLAAMLEIITELERTGDYAKGISRVNLYLGDAPLIKPLIDIPLMAQKATDMLHRALKAFAERDVEAARAIPREDDEVDALYNRVNEELLHLVIADIKNLEQANYLLWAAHNLERAADRVTNICERVVFTVTGEMSELDTHFDAGID